MSAAEKLDDIEDSQQVEDRQDDSQDTGGEPETLADAISSGLTETVEDTPSVRDPLEEGDEGKAPTDSGEENAEGEVDDAEENQRDDQPEHAPEESNESEDPFKEPEGLSDSAKNRFHKLVDTVKQKDAELEQVRGVVHQFQTALQSSGAAPEDVAASLEYIRALKSGTREGIEQAKSILEEQLRMVHMALGETAEARVDILPPELRQRVDNLELTEEDALRIFRAQEIERAQAMQYQQSMQQQQEMMQQQQAQEHYHQRVLSAKQQVEQLEEQWKRTDPAYAAKKEVLQRVLPEIAQRYQPEEWVGALQHFYSTLGSTAAPPPSRRPTPLTGGAASSDQGSPKSLEGALLKAFGMDT